MNRAEVLLCLILLLSVQMFEASCPQRSTAPQAKRRATPMPTSVSATGFKVIGLNAYLTIQVRNPGRVEIWFDENDVLTRQITASYDGIFIFKSSAEMHRFGPEPGPYSPVHLSPGEARTFEYSAWVSDRFKEYAATNPTSASGVKLDQIRAIAKSN